MAIAIVAGAATAAVAELVFRAVDPQGMSYYREAARYFAEMRRGGSFAYIHPPNREETFQGVSIRTNADGLRWSDVDMREDRAKKRLLILGDSVVFGWGVPLDETFPALLQRKLDGVAPAWEVVAAGVGSWNTRTEYEWFRERGVHYASDVVLIFIVSNDAIPNPGSATDVDRTQLFPPDATRAKRAESFVESAWRAACLASDLCRNVLHVGSARREQRVQRDVYAADSAAWRDAELALRGLATLTRDTGARLAAVIYGGDGMAAYRARYESVLQDTGTPFTTIAAVPPERRNSVVDSHPNSAGHVEIADRLWEFLGPLLAEPPAAGPS